MSNLHIYLAEKIYNVTRVACNILTTKTIFYILTICYFCLYFYSPSTPGNHPFEHPQGWWGWFDQGKYYVSAQSLKNLNFNIENHFYPPLYPIVGAVLLNCSTGHPYFLPNLVCFLWYSYIFILFSSIYFNRLISFILLLSTIVANYTLFEDWIIPWTTTLTSGLISTGIYALSYNNKNYNTQGFLSKKVVFLVFLSMGLVVATRPLDSFVSIVICIGLYAQYIFQNRKQNKDYLNFISISVFAGLIGTMLFFIFNLKVSGELLGNYFHIASSNGYFIKAIPSKFLDIFCDGNAVYGEKNTAILLKYPWLYISAAGSVWLLFRGSLAFKIVVTAVFTQYLIYLPYADLIPNGLWRFHNIHYFLWTFPYLALFGLVFLKDIIVALKNRNISTIVCATLIITTILFIPFIRTYSIINESIEYKLNDKKFIEADLNSNKIDFIDLYGFEGDFNSIYFGQHKLIINNFELTRIKDYRIIPLNGHIRVVFNKPIRPNQLILFPDRGIHPINDLIKLESGSFHYKLGIKKEDDKYKGLFNYKYGDSINFSRKGNTQLYVHLEGFSIPEDFGAWSMGKFSEIFLHNAAHPDHKLVMELIMSALVTDKHASQLLMISVNGIKTGEVLFTNKSDAKFSKYHFEIPEKSITNDLNLAIKLITPYCKSPKEIGMNSDERQLSVAIKSLRIY